MLPHRIFFVSTTFFILGVFLKSIGAGFSVLVLTGALILISLALGVLKGRKVFFVSAFLSLFIVLGAFYYTYDDIRFRKGGFLSFGENVTIFGIVDTNPKKSSVTEEFVLKISQSSFRGRVLVRSDAFRDFKYGDAISLSGVVEKIEGDYGRYLEKERIHGIVAFPETINKIGENYGNFFRARLYRLKNLLESSFSKYFGPKSAAFLGGITFGSKAGFDKNFREALQKSGTSHIVALSGYNITILATITMGIFLYIMRRRWAVVLASLVIIGFVIMTGAEASVVRAAVLALIVVFGKEYGRAHDIKNSIMLVAVIMILANPKVLVFDLGFQLSFLAFMGIIYLAPAIRKISHLKEEKGFLSWRENILNTISAQLMVSPLLISQFGFVSIISILTNLLVLSFIPYTMFFAFLLVFSDLIIPSFALILSFIIRPLLSIEFFIIETSAHFDLLVSPTLHLATVVVYYIFLGAIIYYGGNIKKSLR